MLFIELTEKSGKEKLTINASCIVKFEKEGKGCRISCTEAIIGCYSDIIVAESYECIKTMLSVVQAK